MNKSQLAQELWNELKKRTNDSSSIDTLEKAMRELLNEVGTASLELGAEERVEQLKESCPSCGKKNEREATHRNSTSHDDG